MKRKVSNKILSVKGADASQLESNRGISILKEGITIINKMKVEC